ncbi:cytochrome c oxidase assembly protein [Nocardioides sp. W3-2-3]|uniref:cytochrome c oxidase assembly protein n=1 Tax=Nocardioides convexus TaxID=2712224 RepID=UPI003100E06E|nr:cytochrome c oxidase assembly protein [Nocardioides convexus]
MVALRRRGDRWPLGRSIAFALGLVVVAYATFGGLGTYARVMFSAHMAAHMALSMIAPILLVTGAPLQTRPARAARGRRTGWAGTAPGSSPGPSRRVPHACCCTRSPRRCCSSAACTSSTSAVSSAR